MYVCVCLPYVSGASASVNLSWLSWGLGEERETRRKAREEREERS